MPAWPVALEAGTMQTAALPEAQKCVMFLLPGQCRVHQPHTTQHNDYFNKHSNRRVAYSPKTCRPGLASPQTGIKMMLTTPLAPTTLSQSQSCRLPAPAASHTAACCLLGDGGQHICEPHLVGCWEVVRHAAGAQDDALEALVCSTQQQQQTAAAATDTDT